MRRFSFGLVIFTLSVVVAGCSSAPKTPTGPAGPPVLTVSHHVGGAHYRTIVRDNVWYQTFCRRLLVLTTNSNSIVSEVQLGEVGEGGAAVDMTIDGERMYVVLERDALVEIDLSSPRAPVIASKVSGEELGVLPRCFSIVEGEKYVSGETGVLRLSDREVFLPEKRQPGRVVMTTAGPAATVGRRVFALEDGRFLGAASSLRSLRAGGGRADRLIFVLQGETGAAIGLMSPNVREVVSRVVTGTVRSARAFADRLWIVTDSEIVSFARSGDGLGEAQTIAIKGARDLDAIDENHLAVAGSFGRAIYRIESERGREGDTFILAHREPSRLTYAAIDQPRIIAGSEEGVWTYLVGSRARMTERIPENFYAPLTAGRANAATVWGEAEVRESGYAVDITAGEISLMHTPGYGSKITTIIAVDNAIWIGHDNGIDVFDYNEQTEEKPAEIAQTGSLQLDGPVRYIFPRRVGGGVSFVSEFGGFGVAEFVRDG